MNYLQNDVSGIMEPTGLIPPKLKMNHNFRVLLGLAVVFIIGGLQAIKGLTWTNGIETVIPVLIALEHYLNGNTDI